MRKLAAFAIVCAAILSTAQGTGVTLSSSQLGRSVVDASATPVANGSLVLLGTFATPAGFSLATGSAASILAAGNWSQFDGQLAIGTFIGTPDKLVGTATDNTATAVPFNNKTIYLVVFNAATQGAATQMGIFTDPTATGTSAWTFPANAGGVGDSTTLAMDHTGFVSVGSVGTVVGSGNGSTFQLATLVPEPSAAGLLVSGLLGLLGYRRLRFPC